MTQQPSITPAPILPIRREAQTQDPDAAIVSSVEAYFSSAYAVPSYSQNSASLSSLLAYYSSLYGEISVPSYSYSAYSYAGLSATRTVTIGAGTSRGQGGATATGKASQDGGSSSSSSSSSGGGGLSTSAKIGIGVGVPVGVFLLIGIGVWIYCAALRKGKRKGVTIVAGPGQTQPPLDHKFAHVQQRPPDSQGYQQPPGGQYNVVGEGYGYAGPQGVSPVPEMEHSYHFARPGVAEMSDGR